ncbi:hypothetical protein QYM36_010159 [Artemia franciscana]|uniref:DRBM domain-containing protein n=1 Tax=Artemia franciscana TaxID=6661 RepID=A0AA88HWF4_ARTSF|nr:hypothetical protein QYM36_010159 [Artemia franciscana]
MAGKQDPFAHKLSTDSPSPADCLYKLDPTLIFSPESSLTTEGTRFTCSVTKDGRIFTGKGATRKAAKHDVASQVLQAFYPNVTATEDSSLSKQEPGTNQALADEISTVSPVVPQLPKDSASPANRLYRLDSTLVFKDEKWDTLHGFNISVTKDGKTFTGRGVTKKAAKHDVASQVLQAFYPNVTATEDSSSSKQEPGTNQALANEFSTVSPVVPQLPKDSASPADRLYRLDSTLVFKDEKRDTLHGFNISVTKDGKTFTGRGATKKAAKHDVASQVLQAFYSNVTATEDSSSSKQEPGTNQTFADQISTIDPVVPELTTDSSSPADRLYRLDSTLVFKDEKWDTLHGFNISVTKDGKTFTGRAAKQDMAIQVLRVFYSDVPASEDSSSLKLQCGISHVCADRISTFGSNAPELQTDYSPPVDHLYALDSTLSFKFETIITLDGYTCTVRKDRKTFTS